MRAKDCHRILDSIPVGIYQTDLVSSKFIWANNYCANLLGFNSAEELVDNDNKSIDFYANPERRDDLINLLKQNESISDFEICLKTKNGDKVWVCATAKIIQKDNIVEGSLTDITERKKMELEFEKLKQQQAKMLIEMQYKIQEKLTEYNKIKQ